MHSEFVNKFIYLFIFQNTGMKLLGHISFLVFGSFCVVLTPK